MINEETPPVVHEDNPSTNEQPPSGDKYSLLVDEFDLVTGSNYSSIVPEGYIEVPAKVWMEAQQKVGKCIYEDGDIFDIVVAPEPYKP